MNLNPERLVDSILRHENAPLLERRNDGGAETAYQVLGEDHWTIGWGTTRWVSGRAVAKGDVGTVDALYRLALSDIMQAILDATQWLPRMDMTARRNEVIIEMAYQMGLTRLNGFVETRRLIAIGSDVGAAKEMLDSKWARQTPERAREMSEWFRVG